LNGGIEKHVRRWRWVGILAAAGVATTFAVIVGTYRLGKAPRQTPVSKPADLPKDADQQLSGVTFTRSEKGREIFALHAARTLAFKQSGSILLSDVYVEYFGQTGDRYDVLKTAEGEYNPSTGNLSTPGDVEIVLNAPRGKLHGADQTPAETDNKAVGGRQPVYIRTSKVASHEHGTLIESTTPVSFHLGQISGSARGLAYGTDRGEITLKQDVEAVFQPAPVKPPQPPIQLSASQLRYGGSGEGVQLWGPIKIQQGKRTAIADEGVISLSAQNRVTEVLLSGHALMQDQTPRGRITLQSDALQGYLSPATSRLSKLMAVGHVQGDSMQASGVAHLEAHAVVLNFDPVTHAPANGAASGNVHLTITQAPRPLAPTATPPGVIQKASREELSTENLEFTFRHQGKNLKEAQTSGPGTLVLYPESPKSGNRTVTAAKFLMAFDRLSRLESIRGTGGTKIVFEPPANARSQVSAVSTGNLLMATFDPATEAIHTVEQSGDFHFTNGDIEAKGEQALDQEREQKLVLTGHPEVWDSDTRARANQVVVLLASDAAEAIGDVHAIHTDPRDPSSLPTNVVADRMTADHRSQVVHYEGNVRAWRGTDVIESASLEVYKTQRRVSTNSRVLTSHLQPPPAGGNGKMAVHSGPTPLTIRADKLDYFDAGRKARYSGDVELDTQDAKILADRLDVYFSLGKKQSDSEVERAVAEGDVKVVQPLRYAKGENAVYDAQAGKVVMTGGPPTVYDTEKGSVTGQRLTFYIHNDRLLVDGSANAPAVSKHRVAQ